MHKSLLFLLMLPSLELFAQNIEPGNSQINYNQLQTFQARYEMQRNGEFWAIADITLDSIMVSGKKAFRHAYKMRFQGQTVFDETIFLAESMAPVMKFIHGGLPPDLAYSIYHYNGSRLQGSTNHTDGRAVEIDTTYEDQGYFGGGMAYLAMALLDKIEGSFVIKSADPNMVDIGKWTRQESDLPGAEYLFVNENGSKEWLSTKPPYLIKKEFPAYGISWVYRKQE